MKSQISTKSLIALKKALPTGGVKIVAERLELDESTVSKVLSGERNNIAVVEMALTIVEESRAKVAELENKISALS